jgi:hypothetical protein
MNPIILPTTGSQGDFHVGTELKCWPNEIQRSPLAGDVTENDGLHFTVQWDMIGTYRYNLVEEQIKQRNEANKTQNFLAEALHEAPSQEITWKAYSCIGRSRVNPLLLERLKPGSKNPIMIQDTHKDTP